MSDEPTCDSCGEPLTENGECPNIQTILNGVDELPDSDEADHREGATVIDEDDKPDVMSRFDTLRTPVSEPDLEDDRESDGGSE